MTLAKRRFVWYNSLMGVVYKATNLENGKSYIGSTVDFTVRKNHYRLNRSPKTLFEKAVVKYGIEAFSWEILAEIDNVLELRIRECQEIVWINTFVPNGYNYPTQVGSKGKSVQHVETGIVYSTIAEAARELKTTMHTVRRLCNSGKTLINTTDFFDGHLRWYEG